MKIIRQLTLFFFVFFTSFEGKTEILKPGDILLAPMNCYLCKLIEGETNSSFSHLFVYISNGKFAHSLSKVEYIKFNEIINIVDKKRPMLLVRHNKTKFFDPIKIKEIFETDFLNLPYDKNFLWDNRNENNQEMLYCSELVLKLLNKSFNLGLLPVPMSYDRYLEQWENYFENDVPMGLPGVAPGFFENHPDFKQIRYIYL